VEDRLLETKLMVPHLRRPVVPRPRLLDVLDTAAGAALTLVSAPAGFGKSTLVATLVTYRAVADGGRREGGACVAWVSLDERDADPDRFWTYVFRALELARPGCAAAAMTLLEQGRNTVEAALVSVINEISVHPADLTLVLDDYHLADGPEVSAGVGFLLAHRPPQMHLVISTRADPALPLATLRARRDLVELRAADLRFTGEEATSYLNDVQGLDLTAAEVTALESRTEGWIAALQLAALSLRDRDDTASFIEGFAGDDRYVVDYLADEVLDRQPPPVRAFLLQTSVLERLTGPLCDAVTGRSDGRLVLEALERRNLLVVPLDDRRRWYRYHHLFADVLQSRLLAERPDELGSLHNRASEWYEQAGDVDAAVRHAIAAGDVDRAADLMELAVPQLRRRRDEAVVRRWIQHVPAEVVRRRPVLAIGFINALMASNDFDGVERRLNELSEVLSEQSPDVLVRDHAEFTRLPALVPSQRAGMALVSGDLDATIRHADTALARAAPDDLLTRAAASAVKGLASWAGGDLVAAHAAYTVAAHDLHAMGHVADVLGCTVTLVDLEIALGRLEQAGRAADHALRLAHAKAGDGVVRGTADMWVAKSQVTWARGDATATAQHLSAAADLGDAAGLPQQPHRWRIAMASLRAHEGDTQAAATLLEEAERLYTGDFSPDVRPVAATRARLAVRTGDLVAAHVWQRRSGLTVDDPLTYLHEYEHVTVVRVLLAEHLSSGDPAPLLAATALLRRLAEAAESSARVGTLIEVNVLQAIASEAAGRRDDAVSFVDSALTLAEPEGWVRPLADESTRLRQALLPLRRTTRHGAFVRAVDAAAAPAEGRRAAGSRGVNGAQAPLVDPLSRRELQVLRLLGSDLDGPSIARELSLSMATVRTHTQHIYTKLGVTSRRAAVRRAHQLHL